MPLRLPDETIHFPGSPLQRILKGRHLVDPELNHLSVPNATHVSKQAKFLQLTVRKDIPLHQLESINVIKIPPHRTKLHRPCVPIFPPKAKPNVYGSNAISDFISTPETKINNTKIQKPCLRLHVSQEKHLCRLRRRLL